ncbi:hypothetical protein EYF80_050814 [Liparis tanakae]|uniref:Uncharacterized protein n=1 Tax=Liparis tanakae TaxID=230148 RepID=A0A4Z2FF33_9TELE|nr:hypothetical protein EYF80_050814 [Liparis tanakae]
MFHPYEAGGVEQHVLPRVAWSGGEDPQLTAHDLQDTSQVNSPLSTDTLMGALFEPMLLLPTHMYVPESDIWMLGMSRVPMSVRSMRAWRRHTNT